LSASRIWRTASAGARTANRHLIQQRLKDTMVAAIDQDNLGIRAAAPRPRLSRKASANNDDARLSPGGQPAAVSSELVHVA